MYVWCLHYRRKRNSTSSTGTDTVKEQFEQKYYKQTEELAMGAPRSAALAEIHVRVHIQNMEHKQIYPILMKRQVIGYFMYGDDIHFIYNQRKTNTEETLTEFSKQQHVTTGKQLHNSINFLDL
jgi:hypothetical protein